MKTAGNATGNHPGKYVRLWVCSHTILRCRHAITAPHLDSITPRRHVKNVINLLVTAEDYRERCYYYYYCNHEWSRPFSKIRWSHPLIFSWSSYKLFVAKSFLSTDRWSGNTRSTQPVKSLLRVCPNAVVVSAWIDYRQEGKRGRWWKQSPVRGTCRSACCERPVDCMTAAPASVSDRAAVTPRVDHSAPSDHCVACSHAP